MRISIQKFSITNYINAVHNQKIARHAAISQLRKCPSFLEFRRFIEVELN